MWNSFPYTCQTTSRFERISIAIKIRASETAEFCQHDIQIGGDTNFVMYIDDAREFIRAQVSMVYSRDMIVKPKLTTLFRHPMNALIET